MNRRRLISIVRQLLRVSRSLDIPLSRAVPRFWQLVGARRFSPGEVWSLALLDPTLDCARLATYVSKENSWPLYERCNRTSGLELLNNKVLFHSACDQAGLPTLGCVRVMEPDSIRTLGRHISESDSRLLKQNLRALPESFVIKPVEGHHGDGVAFFRREGYRLFQLPGESVDFPGFVRHLKAASRVRSVRGADRNRWQSIMFQEMGIAHPALARLSGTGVMQSVRICTYLDEQGRVELLFGFLKVIAGDSLIDNFQGGRTGNIIADVYQSSGRVTRAIRFDPALDASRPARLHPRTGEALLGFEVPDWPDACALAVRAARAFSQTRAVGWDIGLTDKGPVLLEGNGTWDPVSPFYRTIPTVTEFGMENGKCTNGSEAYLDISGEPSSGA